MTASQDNLMGPIPARAGIGLRLSHLPDVASSETSCASWLEIHSETFLNPGGPRLAMLEEVRRRHSLSCHGVGLSLGSAQGLDPAHLKRLADFFTRIKPALISEHLAWSVVDGTYLNDLLPVPYTEAALRVVSDNVSRAQDAFGRQILVENPSSYLSFAASSMPEAEFLGRLAENTGCGLLLDVNNVYVSATNNGYDARDFLARIPAAAVGEIHLAGHSSSGQDDERILIDTHSTYVCDPVWALYRETVARIGARPTLIEWDMDIPALSELQAEAARAQSVLDEIQEHARVA